MTYEESGKQLDRDPIIFSISINSKYAEEYLEKLSDEELLDTYERVSKKYK
ncbi:hypothetical protein [Psychrobacillus sp. FSL K6-1464]|uniref:hypothetical protein n=1 Tax=Psychrobacillus sp. FSL K6-1464 TaxID=2921545 RepID=UPI0030F624F0